VHIPKTAGKSIERFFLSRRGLGWGQRDKLLLKQNYNPVKGPERLAHLTAEEYVRFGYIPEQDFYACFRFAFVRNPWARMVSEYRYQGYSSKLSFKDFVSNGLPEQDMSDAARHLLPQYDFLYSAGGELMVNFVGRFEMLQTDFDKVCDQLELRSSRLPHFDHPGPRKMSAISRLIALVKRLQPPKDIDYKSYYNAETKRLVEKLYEKDIDTFRYTFDS
jgi:hypothetical protein